MNYKIQGEKIKVNGYILAYDEENELSKYKVYCKGKLFTYLNCDLTSVQEGETVPPEGSCNVSNYNESDLFWY